MNMQFGLLSIVGWPTGLLWCALDVGPETTVRATTGIDTGMSISRMNTPRVLPFRPIWSGQAAYAGFWFVVVFLSRGPVGALWRRARRARGKCGYCGYDLRANTTGICPECGHD